MLKLRVKTLKMFVDFYLVEERRRSSRQISVRSHGEARLRMARHGVKTFPLPLRTSLNILRMVSVPYSVPAAYSSVGSGN